MDFLARQQLLDRSSTHLLAGYAVIVAALTSGLAVTGMGLIAYTAWSRPSFHPGAAAYAWSAAIGAAASMLILALATWITLRRLRTGLASLVRDLKASEITGSDLDPAERRLAHVVEEMAIAAQLPKPRIYLLADEPGINAAAFCWSADDGALVVTLGCLYRLTRDELQAVIAHGLSDLMHRDPALRVRLAALVGGLQGVSAVSLFLLVPLRPRAQGGGPNPLLLPLYPLNAVIGLSLLVSGGLGWLLGELLGAAVMRRRVLAGDLAACHFTRNPPALAGALSKVGGFVFGSRLLAARARDYRHLFLCRTSGPTAGILDAHPPLRRRISSLSPGWDGRFATSRIDTWLADQRAPDQRAE